MTTRVKLKDIELKPYLSTGTNVAYNISIERITEYSDKETFFIDFHVSCGDAPTLNINGLGAKNITIGGVNVSTGQLSAYSGYFIKYNLSLDKFAVIGGGAGGISTCADVKDCIENFTDLDLSNLTNLTLGGNIVFSPSTDIDRTNTNNTGEQNFDGDYTANYVGSTINNTNTTTNNVNTVTNNEGVTETYDNTSNITYEGDVNFEGNTNINNLIIEGAINLKAITTTGTLTAYEVAFSDYTTYSDNDVFILNFHVTNGDNPTLNIESVGAVNLKDGNGDNLIAGVLDVNVPYLCRYDSVDACAYVQLGGSGGGGTTNVAFVKDDFTGVTNTATLSHVPVDEKAVRIVTDSGTELIQGVDWDWTTTIGAKEITFNPVLASEDIYIYYPYALNITTPTNIKRSGNVWGAGGNTVTIADSSITDDSAILAVVTSGTQAGYRQIDVSAGSMTITSSASEDSALEFTYYIISDQAATSEDYVSDEAYGPTWDGVTNIAPSKNALYDKFESIETEIQNVGTLANSSMEMIIEPEANGITTDGTYDYITFTGIVKKYDKNLKFIASLNVASAGVPKYHNGYLYVGSSNAVAKIDPATMTLVDTEAVTGFNCMELVGNYLICACNDSNFRRIDLTTFNVDLTVANGWVNIGGICTDGTYLYVSRDSGVYKISPTTLLQLGNYFDGTSTFGKIAYASGNLFVCKVSGGSNEIRRIETVGMTNLGAGGIGGIFTGITTDGVYIYSHASFGSGTVAHYIMKYEVSTASSYLIGRRADIRYLNVDVARVIGYGTGLFVVLNGMGYTLKI